MDVRLGDGTLYPLSAPIGTTITFSCKVYSPNNQVNIARKCQNGSFRGVFGGGIDEWIPLSLTFQIDGNGNYWVGFNFPASNDLIFYADDFSLIIP